VTVAVVVIAEEPVKELMGYFLQLLPFSSFEQMALPKDGKLRVSPGWGVSLDNQSLYPMRLEEAEGWMTLFCPRCL
jgi:hypothetical protein